MKISKMANYQTNFAANPAKNTLRKTIPVKTAAAALLAASAITLAGCATGKAVYAFTLVPGGQNTQSADPVNDKNYRVQKFIEQLMAMGYMDKKTKTGVNHATSNEGEYLVFKVKNPITEGYNYQNLEKTFGMPKGSLVESNGINKGLFGEKDKNIELSCPNKKKLKIFVDYLPTRVKMWLISTEAERKWM